MENKKMFDFVLENDGFCETIEELSGFESLEEAKKHIDEAMAMAESREADGVTLEEVNADHEHDGGYSHFWRNYGEPIYKIGNSCVEVCIGGEWFVLLADDCHDFTYSENLENFVEEIENGIDRELTRNEREKLEDKIGYWVECENAHYIIEQVEYIVRGCDAEEIIQGFHKTYGDFDGVFETVGTFATLEEAEEELASIGGPVECYASRDTIGERLEVIEREITEL